MLHKAIVIEFIRTLCITYIVEFITRNVHVFVKILCVTKQRAINEKKALCILTSDMDFKLLFSQTGAQLHRRRRRKSRTMYTAASDV